MSQNARVALWVPTDDPPDAAGDVIATNDLPDSIKAIPTRFATGGGGGGGISEAPVNGKPYVRQNADWNDFSVIDGGTF